MEVRCKVGVFHPGTQHSWQTARAFRKSEKLNWYVTSIFYKENKYPYKILKYLPLWIRVRFLKQLRKRYHEELDCNLTHEGSMLEWFKTILVKFKLKKLTRAVHIYSLKSFSNKVIGLLESQPVNVLWGYDACSLEVFEYASSMDVLKVLDYTTIHPSEQNEILSGLQLHKNTNLVSHTNEWIRRVERECQLADIILVGSNYACSTLIKHGVSEKKIHIIPYSYDDTFFSRATINAHINKPIKFIFVGSLKVTKGIVLLCEAFKKMSDLDVQLTVVGHETEEVDLSPFSQIKNINFIGGVSRGNVIEVLSEQDCLILPTYFDGGGIVMYEAAACGLAIVQSKNCGDGVRNNNGLIVESQTVKAYKEAVMYLLNNPEKLKIFKLNSYECSKERSFTVYSKAINATLDKFA